MDRKTSIECITYKKKVVFKNIVYYPLAYILRIRDNKWVHELELKDLRANSITIAEMDNVEVFNDIE